jgi:hypothetical protein
MNKGELYSKILKIYRESGQGTSGYILTNSEVNDLVEELVEDGLVKIVTVSYNHLPDDKWICPTKGYCVEESGDTTNLSYMRLYVGLDMLIDLGDVMKFSSKDAIKDPEFMTGYCEWLNKNKLKLKEIDSIKDEVIDSKVVLSDTEKEYLKSRGWFEKNLTIKESLIKMKNGDDVLQEKIGILNQLIHLMKLKKGQDNSNLAELKSTEEELKAANEEVKMRKKISSLLRSKDENSLSQDLI